MILSLAYSNTCIPTSFLFFLAAIKAASLVKLAKSAPEIPGVPLAISIDLTFFATGISLMCIFIIASRPFMSGKPTVTVRSNLPGLVAQDQERLGGLLLQQR